ncbi:sialic acid-binding Ig-like lectin 14 isoform X2 [Clupea harengus]|uniref:Sialic acid-binding Ig-like lectin 14 isoform X2 n=1 Tax=Clupea harengus TaxID=7950 RepID=A0A6P8FC47_CLUHA|nr:sialic acid-binding Ig-like lectin 14 isoform X2 [Clupea harengus]
MDYMMLNLFFQILFFQAYGEVGAEHKWEVSVPQPLTGLESSCIVLPCTYDYPDTETHIKSWKGIWYFHPDNVIVYDQDSSKVGNSFKTRTSLPGELNKKNCSLQITDIKQSDKGKYWFRTEMDGYNSYSYNDNKVTISIKAEADPPSLSGVKKEVRAGESVTVSCSVSHSCPPHPPTITWSHNGSITVQSEQQTAGQHQLTSSLTFNAIASDHQKSITCSAQYHGGKKAISSVILNVTYAPVNVTVDPWEPSVLENRSIELRCSAKGNPAVHSYQWRNENGSLHTQGHILTLHNVTRLTQAISCATRNSEGETTSRPVKVNVEYPPEISERSFCTRSHSDTQCTCVVESNPPSGVWWIWDNSDKKSPQMQDGFTTMAVDLLPPDLHQIVCFASNIHGNTTKILHVKKDLLYVYISLGAVCALLLLIILTLIFLGFRKRSRTQQQTCETPSHLNNSKPCGKPFSKGDEDDEDVYGNDEMMQDDDGEIYANTAYGGGEERYDDIYANYKSQ